MKPRISWKGLKVMPLDHWMIQRFAEENLKHYDRAEAIFNRNGIYYYKGNSWFEINGKAWLYEANQFLYDIRLASVKLFTNRVHNAMLILKRENLLSGEQENVIFKFENWLIHRSVEMGSKLQRFKAISKIMKKSLTSPKIPVK